MVNFARYHYPMNYVLVVIQKHLIFLSSCFMNALQRKVWVFRGNPLLTHSADWASTSVGGLVPTTERGEKKWNFSAKEPWLKGKISLKQRIWEATWWKILKTQRTTAENRTGEGLLMVIWEIKLWALRSVNPLFGLPYKMFSKVFVLYFSAWISFERKTQMHRVLLQDWHKCKNIAVAVTLLLNINYLIWEEPEDNTAQRKREGEGDGEMSTFFFY